MVPVVLPEDVLWDILVPLPAKDVLSCRAVCRSWRRVTSAADFLLAHHRRQPSLPLIAFDCDNKLSSCSTEAFDFRRSPVETRPVLRLEDRRGNFVVRGSCDGLLLLSLYYNSRLAICNPATRQWTDLPASLACARVGGFYLSLGSSAAGEYRFLCWKLVWRYQCYVVTVGPSSSCAQRCIVSPSVEQLGGAHHLMNVTDHPPAMARGCLHWGQPSSMEKGVVVFDTVAESFRCMRSPVASYRWPGSCVVEMGGDDVLGINHMDAATGVLELWVLEDYDLEAWSLKYRIQLSATFTSIAGWSVNGLVVSCDGDVVVYFHNGDFGAPNGRHLFHCDRNGKLLQILPFDRSLSRRVGYWFKESLVRHTFFDAKGS